MQYTIYVKNPRRRLRKQCRKAVPGRRFVLYEGNGARSDVFRLARQASAEAESVQIVWRDQPEGDRRPAAQLP